MKTDVRWAWALSSIMLCFQGPWGLKRLVAASIMSVFNPASDSLTVKEAVVWGTDIRAIPSAAFIDESQFWICWVKSITSNLFVVLTVNEKLSTLRALTS